jgi:hypothetical protein
VELAPSRPLRKLYSKFPPNLVAAPLGGRQSPSIPLHPLDVLTRARADKTQPGRLALTQPTPKPKRSACSASTTTTTLTTTTTTRASHCAAIRVILSIKLPNSLRAIRQARRSAYTTILTLAPTTKSSLESSEERRISRFQTLPIGGSRSARGCLC